MSYASTVLADSPFSYYQLNESSGTSAADSSGNGHTATYTGTVTLGQAGTVADPGATAVKFDGATGFVSCPSTGVPTGNATWTQELWFMLNTGAATQVLMGWGTSATREEPVIFVDSSNNLIMSTWNTDKIIQAISLGTWYYVAVTYDGTTQTGYVNGSPITTTTPGTVVTPAAPNFTIGTNPSPNKFFAAITVQQVAGYTTALSAARIAAHYAAGAAGLLLRFVNT